MIDVMVLFGADLEEAEQQMEQVYQLEKQIAKVGFPKTTSQTLGLADTTPFIFGIRV